MKFRAKFPSQRECHFAFHARLIVLWAGVLCLFSFIKLLHITDEAWAPCKRLYCMALGFSMLWATTMHDHERVRLLFICFFFTQMGLNMQFLRNMKPKALPLHILLDLVVNLWVVFPQLVLIDMPAHLLIPFECAQVTSSTLFYVQDLGQPLLSAVCRALVTHALVFLAYAAVERRVRASYAEHLQLVAETSAHAEQHEDPLKKTPATQGPPKANNALAEAHAIAEADAYAGETEPPLKSIFASQSLSSTYASSSHPSNMQGTPKANADAEETEPPLMSAFNLPSLSSACASSHPGNISTIKPGIGPSIEPVTEVVGSRQQNPTALTVGEGEGHPVPLFESCGEQQQQRQRQRQRKSPAPETDPSERPPAGDDVLDVQHAMRMAKVLAERAPLYKSKLRNRCLVSIRLQSRNISRSMISDDGLSQLGDLLSNRVPHTMRMTKPAIRQANSPSPMATHPASSPTPHEATLGLPLARPPQSHHYHHHHHQQQQQQQQQRHSPTQQLPWRWCQQQHPQLVKHRRFPGLQHLQAATIAAHWLTSSAAAPVQEPAATEGLTSVCGPAAVEGLTSRQGTAVVEGLMSRQGPVVAQGLTSGHGPAASHGSAPARGCMQGHKLLHGTTMAVQIHSSLQQFSWSDALGAWLPLGMHQAIHICAHSIRAKRSVVLLKRMEGQQQQQQLQAEAQQKQFRSTEDWGQQQQQQQQPQAAHHEVIKHTEGQQLQQQQAPQHDQASLVLSTDHIGAQCGLHHHHHHQQQQQQQQHSNPFSNTYTLLLDLDACIRQGEVLEGSGPSPVSVDTPPGSLVCMASLNGRHLPTRMANMTPLQGGSRSDGRKVMRVTLEISMEETEDSPHLLVLDLWNGHAVAAPSCPVVLLPPSMSDRLQELVSLLDRG